MYRIVSVSWKSFIKSFSGNYLYEFESSLLIEFYARCRWPYSLLCTVLHPVAYAGGLGGKNFVRTKTTVHYTFLRHVISCPSFCLLVNSGLCGLYTVKCVVLNLEMYKNAFDGEWKFGAPLRNAACTAALASFVGGNCVVWTVCPSIYISCSIRRFVSRKRAWAPPGGRTGRTCVHYFF